MHPFKMSLMHFSPWNPLTEGDMNGFPEIHNPLGLYAQSVRVLSSGQKGYNFSHVLKGLMTN